MPRFHGVSHISPFHGSRVFARLHHNQTLPARHAGISRFSRRIPEGKRGHSRGITQIHHSCRKKFHLLPANDPPGWEGAFMASCSVRSDPGMGSGHVTLQPPAWWEKGFPSPAHSRCPREGDEAPGKKKSLDLLLTLSLLKGFSSKTSQFWWIWGQIRALGAAGMGVNPKEEVKIHLKSMEMACLEYNPVFPDSAGTSQAWKMWFFGAESSFSPSWE